ncbi:MAG: type II toxin-antitoxin system Phd/YefM family antitoxin [Limisphaerales bacterium]
MKTITAEQAGRQFEKFARIANGGERILVTQNGRPWVVLQPPPRARRAPLAGQWPDYPAHWRQHFPEGFSRGPTAAELLAQDREDRF